MQRNEIKCLSVKDIIAKSKSRIKSYIIILFQIYEPVINNLISEILRLKNDFTEEMFSFLTF